MTSSYKKKREGVVNVANKKEEYNERDKNNKNKEILHKKCPKEQSGVGSVQLRWGHSCTPYF